VTVWFADASVLLAREDADDDQHRAARRLLSGEAPLATLDLAYYEVSNVAIRAWRDPDAARRLQGLVRALADDGGLLRVDDALVTEATAIAERHGLSVYDAAYVAGARAASAELVSCDLRDLVSQDLALTPEQACEAGYS
jgi:predicted nucleic acid-binding protein